MSNLDRAESCTWCKEIKCIHDIDCINGYFICSECMKIPTAIEEIRKATRGDDSLDEDEDDNNGMVWDEDSEEWVYPEESESSYKPYR